MDDRFVDNTDGTVTDNCTGLTWEQTTGNGGVPFPSGTSWCDALDYCEALELGDHTDWRLPNPRELESLVDYDRVSPAIDPVFGVVDNGTGYHWASSTFIGIPTHAFRVGFFDAQHHIAAKAGDASPNHVLAVRGP